MKAISKVCSSEALNALASNDPTYSLSKQVVDSRRRVPVIYVVASLGGSCVGLRSISPFAR